MRKLLACGAVVAALLTAPAAAQDSGFGSLRPDAGPAEIDASIAWIDYVLGRVDKGDLLLLNFNALISGVNEQLLIPANRDDVIQTVQLKVAVGEMSAQKGAHVLLALAKDTSRYRTGLRAQRQKLVAQRAQVRARPSAPPPRPPPPAARDEEPTGLVGERFSEVCAAIGVQNCARMYADVSVILARYGARIGWINGMDQRAPPGDPGRGVTSWDAHYRHGAGPGAGRLGGPIAQRLEDLHYGLDPATEARMEREANGAINGYAPKY